MAGSSPITIPDASASWTSRRPRRWSTIRACAGSAPSRSRPNLTRRGLLRLFAGSRAPLKSALLDQKRIAGLGNIYVCEALFRAGLKPSRPASVLADARGAPTKAAAAVSKAIRAVLEEAVAAGGSTLRDHRQANGELGYFQHVFQVYDREGLPCMREGVAEPIARITQSGRSTFYCSKCQR